VSGENGRNRPITSISFIDEPGREILVKMGKPQKTPGEQDFYCPYQITGLGDEKPDAIVGIDSFQAMQLALRSIGGAPVAEPYGDGEAPLGMR
jgi:hypothetical protein